MALFLAPLAILATWILLIGLTVGIGGLPRRALSGQRPHDAGSVAACFWIGLAISVLFLQAWHFVAPIGRAAFLTFVSLGAAGLVLNGRALINWLVAIPRRQGYGALAALTIVGWWIGNRALAEVAAFDTGMYHIPMLEWIRTQPVVPGLANLHGRFGFNNSNLLLGALLEGGPWVAGSTYLLNGWFALPVAGLGIARIASWPGLDAAGKKRAIFELLLIPPTIGLVADGRLFSGLMSDVPATLACFAGATLLYGALAQRDGDREFTAVAGLATLTMAATIKLSVAALVGPAVLIGGWALLSGARPALRGRARIGAGVLVLGLAATWAARGVVLSGYPLYPSRVAPAPVDWRVPDEQARAELAWVQYFARVSAWPTAYHSGYAERIEGLAWLRRWGRSLFDRERLWRIALPALGTAVFLLVALARSPRRFAFRDPAWLLVPPIAAALLFWWITTPRPVFGIFAAWLACALAGMVALRDVSRTGVAAGVAIASLAIIAHAGTLRPGVAGDVGGWIAGGWLVDPEPGSWLRPSLWNYPLEAYTTGSGLRLWVPVGHRCGRAHPPCTSHPAVNLTLRRPDDMAAGFVQPGPWRAERWPNPWSNFLAAWREEQRRAGTPDVNGGGR